LLPNALAMVITMPAETQLLLDTIDMASVGSIVDPWSGMGTIARVCQSRGIHVHTNDLNVRSPACECRDALLHATYVAWKSARMLDAVVTSPHFAFLDLALPLAVGMVQRVACIHCPGHYFFDATPQRIIYFRLLEAQGRLHIILHLPHGPIGRRCIWICVFRTRRDRDLLLRAPPNTSSSWGLQFCAGPDDEADWRGRHA
jgi:hypothetical protein